QTETEATGAPQKHHYTLNQQVGSITRDACENGDGTVPLRAGQIVHENIRERLAVQVLHEAAYRDTLSQAFALRSIIKIAQQVNYDKEMVFA
ncbi:hypothetical protein M0O88_07675, partial [Klebsiella pneumoniae]|nr:hypothetical protein [Klebsiella pneumoniae]